MAFTGRATYDDTDSIMQDVSDLVTLNSPHVTPLLDFLGDGPYPAQNTKHEWVEDALNAWTTTVNETFSDSDTTLTVADGTVMRAGDVLLIEDELLYCSAVSTNDLTVTRGHGDSTAAAHASGTTITIVGTAHMEGADAVADRSVSRSTKSNYCQIFARTIKVSKTADAVSYIGGKQEYEAQKANRVKECLVDLEKALIIGSVQASTPQGSGTIARTLQGIRHTISTNSNNASSATLTEELWRGYLRDAWTNGARDMDFAVMGAFQKNLISGFKQAATRWDEGQTTQTVMTTYYNCDFGAIKLILNPWVPADEIIVGSSKNIDVIPLKGRSFQHQPLASVGDYTLGQVIGEYTAEVRHEESHMLVYSLATS